MAPPAPTAATPVLSPPVLSAGAPTAPPASSAPPSSLKGTPLPEAIPLSTSSVDAVRTALGGLSVQAPTPALKLYGPAPAPNVQRAVMALHEAGRPFELVSVDLMRGEQREPWFLEISPFGATPALTDEGQGLRLAESRAICRYVLETCGDPEKARELLGRDAAERAAVNQWLDAEALSFSSAAGGIAIERLRKQLRGTPEDPQRVKECAGRAAAALDVYERRLATADSRGFLACGRLTLADLSNAPFLSLLAPAGFADLVSSRPHVAAWWETVRSRPSWQKVEAGLTLPKLIKLRAQQKET